MSEQEQIEILDEESIITARRKGRDMAGEAGFRTVDCAQIATAISELARNIFTYARSGFVSMEIVAVGEGRTGMEITALDTGPGIRDMELVMRDGYSTSNGLGMGLPGTRRIVGEFEIESEPGRGTLVKVTKWMRRR